ncbi:hypothetical protein PANT111_160271 [Pantoea brenneri]|uniref:Uncharacterized protein n=1 Tax=Pantoea brenneri TaxID=472694 RepID=A0AAX3J4S5_9GAMM|nr:hypothetical protein PANT111_160271 [Pantoea brenneri]
MNCRFYQQIHSLTAAVNRPTKIREARFNKNYFQTLSTFIRISLVAFWKIWFEKCTDGFALLKYQ